MKKVKTLKAKEEVNSQKINIAIANYIKNKIDSLIDFSKISEVFRKEEKRKNTPPNLITILLNTINIFEEEIIKLKLEKAKPDFLIEPNTSKINSREFFKAKDAIQVGEKAAEAVVPKVKKVIESKSLSVKF